jgi:chromosome partitioning protein
MTNKVAFINGKGGCGKTTSIFHVAGVLSKAGEKVLVIDFDKQKNTTDTLLMNSEKPSNNVLDFLLGNATAAEATAQALFQTRGNANPKYYGVDCMAAATGLEDESLLQTVDREAFGDALNEFINERGYTWVLVDMPPSNKELNDICFERVVDFVLVPFSSDIFSVSGYGDILNMLDTAREKNPRLNIIGIYLARYMEQCGVDKYIREQLREQRGFIDVQIPLASDVREAVMFGRPISYYKLLSKSKTAYENLVNEMTKRIDATR